MLCYVTRPDSVVMEVEVDAKANGEDCLNKVRRPGWTTPRLSILIDLAFNVSRDRVLQLSWKNKQTKTFQCKLH